jgi:hypothetical protein
VQPLGSSQHSMEPEGSLPRSQELFTCTYPAPDQSSSQHSILSASATTTNTNITISTGSRTIATSSTTITITATTEILN